jgi:hypothetical protein
MSHRIKTTLGNRLFGLAISDDADPGEVEDLIVEWEATGPRPLTVERLAHAIHEANIHFVHGDPDAQARRIINVLEGREYHEDAK